ncbi:anhydro-N-acetylmuramic acid kinase [Idiomarina seosinensis]|uniref:anhydro-N-acetylmuramic acid kinase n=1 Tax=Idiomarina seosinensis TaxID=281739 RepID=UPI00384DAC2B
MQRFIGVMSGTSVDAVDAVLCRINNQGALQLEGFYSTVIPLPLKKRLQQAMTDKPQSLTQFKQLEADYSRQVSDTINTLLHHQSIDSKDITAAGCHGQTLWHFPPSRANTNAPFSLQLLNAAQVSMQTGISIISDFRQKDIAAGGEGAPLVPAFHHHLLEATPDNRKAVLNLGGIANITLLNGQQDEVLGFDTGPANTLLDSWYRSHYSSGDYDEDGKIAASGSINQPLLSRLLGEPYFTKQAPKSTGRELFNPIWLSSRLAGDERPQDVMATLIELTAITCIAGIRSLTDNISEVIACGGGVNNGALMSALRGQLQQQFGQVIPLRTTLEYGIDPQRVEAMAFAWFAWCYEHKKPANLPAVTGARCPVILGSKVVAN